MNSEILNNYKGYERLQREIIKVKQEAERAKRIAEENWLNLDVMLTNVEAVLWEIDDKGIFTLFKGKALEKFRVKPNNVIGLSIFDVYGKLNKSIQATKSVLQGVSCRYEETYENLIFDVKYNPLFDGEGKVYGAAAIASDITSIKRMEQRLKENDTRYKLASEVARVASYDWYVEADLIIVDEMWGKSLGYEINEIADMTTQKYNELTHPDDLEKQNSIIQKHFAGEAEYYECEVRMRNRKGEWVWVLDRGRVIERSADGRPIRVVGTHIDITQRKNIEEIESLLKEKLREESLKNEFFANISHELRTPVNVIYSATQLAADNFERNDIRQIVKYNKTIRQNCLRLIRIINNIIDITKIEAGFFKPECKVQNLVSIVENIALSVVDYAEIKNISVIFDTDCEEYFVSCDSNFMERIVLNLLSNSVKYGKENGRIDVCINKKTDGTVVLVIKDDGIGIPEDFMNNIFRRFQRVDKSMSRITEGSGIGLSLVKSLVEIQNGTITLSSTVNEGTEFIIEFPLVEACEELNEGRTRKDNSLLDNHLVEKVNIEFSDIYV